MAALYGRLRGNRGEVTRMGSANSGIKSKLETWSGNVTTEVEANGDYVVYSSACKSGHGTPVLRGNFEEGWAELILNGKFSHRQSIDEGAGVVARIAGVGTAGGRVEEVA